MYKCRMCGEEFMDPVETYDDPSPAGVSLPQGAYKDYACPECGSDDFEPMKECPRCGEYHDEKTTFCYDCAEELSDALDSLKYQFGVSDYDFDDALGDYIER